MRSQASKSSPKKGVVKTSLKTKPPAKKPVSPKKNKLVGKSFLKGAKKNTPKEDSNSDGDAAGDKQDNPSENVRAGPSKVSSFRTESPPGKAKKDPKEKKEPIKKTSENNTKKGIPKKPSKIAKNKKPPSKQVGKNNDAKNKVTKNVIKKTKPKYSKAKIVVKKGKVGSFTQKKKYTPQSESDSAVEENVDDNETNFKEVNCNDDSKSSTKEEEKATSIQVSEELKQQIIETEEKIETQSASSSVSSDQSIDVTPIKDSPERKQETPKSETERPPKFFTSARSPRMVDIDIKCLKNSKGNLSVSERFVSMKCETKSDDSNKDKPVQNTLVSQGPEIDVYTFTEKVDSPKSVLSDFRSSVNKNVGRVRPIARVKGTVVDKTSEADKKKYSPHRPIEEVVQQLKASKRTEEANTSQSSIDLSIRTNDNKESDDAPKAIVSKSYKMVARKSSVTGKPFSPIKFPDQETSPSGETKCSAKDSVSTKKQPTKIKNESKISSSDDESDSSKFALNNKNAQYSSSDESDNDSNDESKESSGSNASKNKKSKNKRYRKIMDSSKKTTSKELKELSKDSLIDLKEEDMLLLGSEKPSKRRRKLLSMWNGPKKHRMASLNALAKVHCLYENESRTHMELGLMRTVDRAPVPSTSKQTTTSKKKEVKSKEPEKHDTTSESEYENKKEKKDDSSESSDDSPPQRTLRGVPGIRSAGKYWDPKSCTSSSEESELESQKKTTPEKKKIVKASSSSGKSDSDKPPNAKMKKTAGVPIKKKRNRNEVVMDLKDMVVQKRMASLNATAILAASYEKRSPKSNKDETTSDSCSDESFSQKPKNGVASGVKSETKIEEPKKEKDDDDSAGADKKQKVEVIVNQDTDVTITGVYSTHHHEGFCTVSGLQYRISSTSHTQTTATANCEKEGCSRDDGARYTPLSALSSMQPPADHGHSHPHPVPTELGGLTRRAGCSSAFSAPSPSAHHEPGKPVCSLCDDMTRTPYGYYQPAGPLIKEGSADERALARYHLPHHHAPHPPVMPQYGPYYPEYCYGSYYRAPGPYHMPPPQGERPMGGLGNEPYPPPQYYSTPPPCYQHSPQRIPYVEYRGCPCPLNACPKNVLIGPATGKAPTGGGPDVPSALATPGGAFRAKVRACALDAAADTHGSGKDPPLESEQPAAADAPHPCPLPAIGGASPKREMFDVRDLRIASDVRAGEVIGPPSPARGSDAACAPQPPSAPRRARLGKAMARRSLAGDDTGLLLTVTPPNPPPAHSDADDDVLAISPPLSVPIDLSSSDERSTPLVDIKKENEGPTFASARNPEAQALREHNSARATTEVTTGGDTNKPAKRRYSRTKLEIDMKDTQLEEGCKTNGIGEHVKLIKRRKVSGDQTEAPRVETVTKEPKKKTAQPKKTPKSPPAEKKTTKRKLDNPAAGPRVKKILLETLSDENPRVGNGIAVPNGVPAIKDKDDLSPQKPKTKSALLLDNLLRKNSIDRAPEKEPNPAELFLSPIENIAQNCAKKMLNINNNIVENANTVSGVRPDTIAAVSQLIGKKLAYKNACKLDKVDSKVTHNVKSVLKQPTVKPNLKEVRKTLNKCDPKEDPKQNGKLEREMPEPVTLQKDDKREISKDKKTEKRADDKPAKESAPKSAIAAKPNPKDKVHAPTESSKESQKVEPERATIEIEKVESAKTKRCKLAVSEIKAKNVEKVIKLLVSKRPVIKTDEATLVVEEACASPVPFSGARRTKRRGSKRGRRPLALATLPTLEPRVQPRWSNGWTWHGEHYLSKVYLNNDSRLDRLARCWPRMSHPSGDKVARGDCVLLRATPSRAQPFVARVASMWENPDDGEMMLSLVWYYRPEHTHSGRLPEDAPDEVFASRHRDANSVACIEDKCYVLTFNEYCRYRKRLKAAEEGVTIAPTIVPPLPASEVNPMFAPNDSKLPPTVSPELVLFCRKVYDFRSKKLHVPNK